MKRIFLIFSILFLQGHIMADCVYSVKDKSKYSRLDNHTLVLSGGHGNSIMIKTYCYVYNSSEVQVLKDDFCSYEDSVLYIDREVCDAKQVTKL